MKLNKLVSFALFLLVLSISFGISSISVYAQETIYGTVSDTTNAKLNGVTVELANNTNVINSTTTNAQGFYNLSFDVNVSNTYNLSFSLATYTTVNSSQVILNNVTFKEVNQTLGPPVVGNITGFTFNSTGLLESVTLTITRADANYVITTNSTGGYNTQVNPSVYNMTASKSGYVDATSSNVNVANGANVSANFTLTKAATTGNVYGYIIDRSSSGLSGAAVKLDQSGATIKTNQTNGTGFYNISVTGGTYNITSTLSNYRSNSTTVSISNGAETNINLTLIPIGGISGAVKKTDGTAIGGASVKLKVGGNELYSFTSDGGGSFSSNEIEATTYTAEVEASGFNILTQSVTVNTGSTASVTLELTATSSSSSSGSSSRGGGGSSSSATTTTTTQAQTTAESGAEAAKAVEFAIGTIADKTEISVTEEKIAVNKIEIDVKEEAKDVKIKVKDVIASELSQASELSNVYKVIQIEHENLDDSNIEGATIDFKVEKEWLADNNVAEDDVVLNRLEGDNWNALETVKSSSDDNLVYYSAKSPGLSYFAISAKQAAEAEETQEKGEETKEESAEEEDQGSAGSIFKLSGVSKIFALGFGAAVIVIILAVIVMAAKKLKGKKKRTKR